MRRYIRASRSAVVLLAAWLLAFLSAAPVLSAESLLPLASSAGSTLGGTGGPHFRLTWFAGQPSMLGGGPAYIIVHRSLYLGLSGSYLEGNADEFMIGYGGPSAAWLLLPDSWLSVWLGATAGVGGMGDPASGSSGVVVLEPEAVAQVAVGPYCRVGLGASYRWVLPFDEVPGYGMKELSGPAVVARLIYGVFQPAASQASAQAAIPGSASPNPGVGIVGCWSQKLSLVRGQVTLFDGGYTRLILGDRWAIGAMGYRTPGGTRVGVNDFQMMESGVWVERLFSPFGFIQLSLGALTGLALVGYMTPADELVGSAALLFNPELLCYLHVSDFVRLSASLGYRSAIPFQEVPELDYWDCNGPTLSLNVVFGVF